MLHAARLTELVSVRFPSCLSDVHALDQSFCCVALARGTVVFPLVHVYQQEDPSTAFFITLDLLDIDMVIVSLLLRYYKHNFGPLFGAVCMLYFCTHTCTYLPLGTLRPIYRTGVKLPSRCPILYLFNKYPYRIF